MSDEPDGYGGPLEDEPVFELSLPEVSMLWADIYWKQLQLGGLSVAVAGAMVQEELEKRELMPGARNNTSQAIQALLDLQAEFRAFMVEHAGEAAVKQMEEMMQKVNRSL